MPQISMSIFDRDNPARLFRAVAVEDLPEVPSWWPNDKQLVIAFQRADLESMRRCLQAM